jgi:hypothetical protein
MTVHDIDSTVYNSARKETREDYLSVLAKSIALAREALLTERKSVPAGTLPTVTNEFDADMSEPFTAQQAKDPTP